MNNNKITELKLPSGATIKIQELTPWEIRLAVMQKMFKGFAEPGRYADKQNNFNVGHLRIADIRYIQNWMAKNPMVERIP